MTIPEKPRISRQRYKTTPPDQRQFELFALVERSRRIRTIAAVRVEVPILEIKPPPVYQRIAPEAKHLQELGMSQSEIGRRLGVDRWTVGKALRRLAEISSTL